MVMARTYFWGWVAVLVSAVGCGSGGSDEGRVTIVVSTGGGLVGLYEGCRLQSSGSIERWRRIGEGGEDVLWRGEVSVEVARGWRNRLERSGALDAPDRRTGNMTARVTYVHADTTLERSWPVVATDNESSLGRWHAELTAFCKTLNGE